MSRKQRLELTWIGKDERPRLEPRILLEDTEKSFHAPYRITEHDIFDNRLIFGDNLLALKALEQEFTGKVKCIFIDPPYNTGSAFEHYDDGVEHSIWLGLMRDRLEILRNLLAEDGSIWITIDDNEAHYLKVMCDELFGRKNFVANVVWQKRTSPDNRLRLGDAHDNIIVYFKNKENGKNSINQLSINESRVDDFKNLDNDPRGPWASTDFTGMTGHATASQFYTIQSPSGKEYPPPPGRCWAISEDKFKELICDNRVWFGKNGSSRPRLKRFLNEMSGQNSWTWWPNSEVGHNQEAKKEIVSLFGAHNSFDTPKPERLLKRILEIATNPSDLILDSFAGSGTTGAVAQKMGRRWIMIELGEHCHTHIIPRLQKVINNEDPGGITKTVNWQGGGGFRYYKLAPSLLEKDKYDNWIISPKYNPAMLAEAMCKLMGFTYAPSQTHYWNQGYSSESDHIYVTTNTLTHDQLQAINQELRDDQTLLICCKAFRANPDDFPKLTIKKIPQSVLHQCEWGHDDYSLNVANLKTLEKPPQPIQPQQLSLL